MLKKSISGTLFKIKELGLCFFLKKEKKSKGKKKKKKKRKNKPNIETGNVY